MRVRDELVGEAGAAEDEGAEAERGWCVLSRRRGHAVFLSFFVVVTIPFTTVSFDVDIWMFPCKDEVWLIK